MDHTQFNIRNQEGQVLCPACGWAGYFRGNSYDELGGLIATGICRCCGFEPGFDDDRGASAKAEATVPASILKYRANWIKAGMPWHAGDGVEAPANWDGKAHLDLLLDLAPPSIGSHAG